MRNTEAREPGALPGDLWSKYSTKARRSQLADSQAKRDWMKANTTRKTLYFEGAGCAPRAYVPNCRIRTAFHLDDGRPVYLEISGMETTRCPAPC